jgi:hypothetical protein
MVSFILSAHIFIGLITLIACMKSVVNVRKSDIGVISFLTLASVGSGSLLSIFSHDTVLTYCVRIGSYILLIGIVQALLFVRTGTPMRSLFNFANTASLLSIVATISTL